MKQADLSPRVELLAVTPEAEKVIEKAARTCYASQDKITDDSASGLISRLITRGHHSVLEHAYATFRISEVSRAMSHQLVRHRLLSISQQSQRYCDMREHNWVEPSSIKENPLTHEIFTNSIEQLREAYAELLKHNIPKEDARYLLPNAWHTEVVISGNFREFLHIGNLRVCHFAQWEIREVALEMILTLRRFAPTVFALDSFTCCNKCDSCIKVELLR